MLATAAISIENNRNLVKQTRQVRKKPINKRYKLLLTCVVCNGDAHGYNFDAISCESCKAFFRRNALRPPGKLKCRGDGHCDVGFNQRKRCKKCRLEKCLRTGMRKEWILTEKEKQEKRLKIELNRRLRQTRENSRHYIKRELKTEEESLVTQLYHGPPVNCNQVSLTKMDWSKIEFLTTAYIEAVRLNQTAGISQYPLIQPIRSTLELFRVPLYISSMRLITFFKQVPEFQRLDRDEQVYFVKLNTLCIAFLHSMYIYDDKKEVYHEPATTDPLFIDQDWTNTINKEFHYELKQIQANLLDTKQIDDKTMKIFFLIILFSNNFNFKCSTVNVNTLNTMKSQNIYIELFYKYCLQHFGFQRSPVLLLKLTSNLMKLQKLISDFKFTAYEYMDLTLLTPVMQSLL